MSDRDEGRADAAQALPPVLDVCCGSRCFYFDKEDKRVLACDIRREDLVIGKNRTCYVRPDEIHDFRQLPEEWTERFHQVVFDPPHLTHAGKGSWLRAKYGVLNPETWQNDIALGFKECFRVLKPYGTLIFKWNDYYIPLEDVLKCTKAKPVFGNRLPSKSKTHFLVFLKEPVNPSDETQLELF